MPEAPDQPAKPVRTWRPMALWTAAIVAALGLAWFVAAVAVPVFRTRAVVCEYNAFWNPPLKRDSSGRKQSWGWSGEMVREVREAAIAKLGGPRRARQRLWMYLRTPSFATVHRKYAAELLGSCGGEAADFLTAALRDQDEEVRSKVAEALGNLGKDGRRAFPALLDALTDSSNQVKQAAAYSLAQLAPDVDGAVPMLLSVLDRKDSIMRAGASAALGHMKLEDPAIVPALVAALSDPSPEARYCAAWALGRTGPAAREAAPPLTRRLSDENWPVRMVAAWALGQIGSPEKIEVPWSSGYHESAYGVRSCGGPSSMSSECAAPAEAVTQLLAMLKEAEESSRVNAAALLGGMGAVARPAVPALVAALTDSEYAVRTNAAWALGRIGDTRAVEPLRSVLKDENGRARKYTAEALGRFGPAAKEACPEIELLLKDEDQWVRQAAAEALKKIRGEEPPKP